MVLIYRVSVSGLRWLDLGQGDANERRPLWKTGDFKQESSQGNFGDQGI